MAFLPSDRVFAELVSENRDVAGIIEYINRSNTLTVRMQEFASAGGEIWFGDVDGATVENLPDPNNPGQTIPVIWFPAAFQTQNAEGLTSYITHELDHVRRLLLNQTNPVPASDSDTYAAAMVREEAYADALAYVVQQEIIASGLQVSFGLSDWQRNAAVAVTNPNMSAAEIQEAVAVSFVPWMARERQDFIRYKNQWLENYQLDEVEIDPDSVQVFDDDKDGIIDALKYRDMAQQNETLLIKDPETGRMLHVHDVLDDLLDGLDSAVIDVLRHKLADAVDSPWGVNARQEGGSGLYIAEVSFTTAEIFLAAQLFVPSYPRDPLTLDLDGDGLETIGVAQSGVLFDHEADGIRTATGWIGSDDGLLALDRNANGVVDSGRELFGDSTPLASGGTAADGFAALAQEDTNSDGIVNSADARWSDLRIWRDFNQDGISQAAELFTLDSLGIASISVAAIEHLQLLPNGNRIADLGSYTKTDGHVGSVARVGLAADVDLAENTFVREFAESVAIAGDVWSLPEMEGSGKVRDLREAASLSTDLKDVLIDYAAATQRSEQLNLVDSVLLNWADTADMPTMQERVAAITNDQNPSGYVHRWNAIGSHQAETYQTGLDASGNPIYHEDWHALVQHWEARLRVLEAFNGRAFFAFPGENSTGAAVGLTIQNGTSGEPGTISTSLTQAHVTLLSGSYEAIANSVYGALTMQTRLKTVLAELDLGIDTQGRFIVDSSGLQALLQARVDQNAVAGLLDVGDFARYSSLRTVGATLLESNVRALVVTPELQAVYDELRITVEGNPGFSNEGADKDDIIVAGAGNNTIQGAGGSDFLFGGAGSDTLLGSTGDDVLIGGAGNDTLYGGTNWGGESGNDSYVFAPGFGQDLVVDQGAADGLDKIRLTGISPSEVTLTRTINGFDVGFDLVMSINGTTDTITVQNYFAHSAYRIEQVEFDGGLVWDAAEFAVARIVPTAANSSSIYGTQEAEVYDLRNATSTRIDSARNGGDSGSDVYIFAAGSGQDTISDTGTAAGHTDTIELRGVSPSAVTLTRGISGSYVIADLVISINASDTLTIDEYFHDSGAYEIERLQFDDGTVWSSAELALALVVPTAATSNNIYGTPGSEAYDLRNAASTRIDATSGGDNSGSDTYLFAEGSGQDVIRDYGTAVQDVDTIRITGKSPSDVTVSRTMSGNYVAADLMIAINGTADTLKIQDYFLSNALKIERVEFDNGTVWSTAELDQAAVIPTVSSAVYGTADAEVFDLRNAASNMISGGLGDDKYLFGPNAGQDTINEHSTGTGNIDSIRLVGLNASQVAVNRTISNNYVGNDLVISITNTADRLTVQNYFGGESFKVERVELDNGTVWGAAELGLASVLPTASSAVYGTPEAEVFDLRHAASNTISGGLGSDSYIFALASGQDAISEYGTILGHIDSVKLVGLAPSAVTLSRGISGNNVTSDLLISIAGTADKLTVQNYFAGGDYEIERVEFDNGTVWSASELDAARVIPTVAGQVTGTADAETFDLRNSVSNTVYGGSNWGGESGSDTYVFGVGGSQDTIVDLGTAVDHIDSIKLVGGVQPAEVTLSRNFANTADLWLNINGTADRLTIVNYFSGNAHKIERVEFDNGQVWGAAELAQAPVSGTASGETIQGQNDVADFIQGLGGNDTLFGYSGNDTLDGGTGNDTLFGGSSSNDGLGNDTYVFARGSGTDTIYDYDTTVNNADTIKLAADVLPSEVTLSRDPASSVDLWVTIDATTDRMIVKNWFYGSAHGVERIEFANGTVWDTTVMAQAPVLGTAGGETIYGQTISDVIRGLGGNDTLFGYAGDDRLDGGEGNDTLFGGSSSNDGPGNDTYMFGPGGGQDTIYDNDTAAGNTDTVRLVGVLPAEVTLTRGISGNSVSSDLAILVNGTADKITVSNHFASNGYKIERVEFDNGTVWGVAELDATQAVVPTAAGALYGTTGADTFDLRNAVNTNAYGVYSGESGNDTYIFGAGAGQDTISDYGAAAGHTDTIKLVGVQSSGVTLSRATSGNSVTNDLVILINGTTDRLTALNHFVSSDYKIERVEFDNGLVWGVADLDAAPVIPTAAGNVVGTNGAEVFDLRNAVSSTAYGAYSGESGNDTYIFGAGAGQDVISDYGTAAGHIDTIKVVGIQPAGVTLTRAISGNSVTNDLVLSVNGAPDKLTVQNYFAGNEYKIERVEFDNSTVWTAVELAVAAVVPTVAGNVVGTTYADVFDLRNAVNSTAYGAYSGESGNDTYIFGAGAGQDVISDYGTAAGHIDTIAVIGVQSSAVTLTRAISGNSVTNDLTVSINGTSDKLTVQNYFAGNEYKIERVEFDNGTVWGVAELDAAPVLPTAAGNVVGTNGADAFDLRNAVSSTAYGANGGDSGNDVYMFGVGAGQDTIWDYGTAAGNVDAIKVVGVGPSDVTLTRDPANSADLWVTLNGTTDRLVVKNWFSGTEYRVERIDFDNGTTLDTALLMQAPVMGTTANETIQGSDHADVILGKEGNDALHGHSGDDTLDGGAGADSLFGGAGNDILDGNAGIDTLTGGLGQDLFDFNLLEDGASASPRCSTRKRSTTRRPAAQVTRPTRTRPRTPRPASSSPVSSQSTT